MSLDLEAIRRRAMDCAQGEVEQWDKGPMFEALDASQRDVGPLLDEVQRLRSVAVERLPREALEPPPTDNDWLQMESSRRGFWRPLFTRSKET